MERWKIEEIGKKLEEKANKLLQVTVLESDARLKMGTPVDTGRLRASWQISENTDSASTPIGVGPKTKYNDRAPAQMITSPATNALKVVRTGPKGVNYKPLNEKIGNTYVISNNMEYAEPICYGTGLPASWKKAGIKGSSQNPPPWVEQIAKSMQRYIEFNWDKIVRETN